MSNTDYEAGYNAGESDALSNHYAEVDRLRLLGDEMARQIEARWSGDKGCACAVCSAAKAWREATRSIA